MSGRVDCVSFHIARSSNSSQNFLFSGLDEIASSHCDQIVLSPLQAAPAILSVSDSIAEPEQHRNGIPRSNSGEIVAIDPMRPVLIHDVPETLQYSWFGVSDAVGNVDRRVGPPSRRDLRAVTCGSQYLKAYEINCTNARCRAFAGPVEVLTMRSMTSGRRCRAPISSWDGECSSVRRASITVLTG